ncbi:MAG: hypothetical protein AAFV93_01025 [Chloroflexota bacterium]
MRKPKSKPRRYKGCLTIVGSFFGFLFICYISMWMFAVYGGEWATDSDFPIPENAELLYVHTTYHARPWVDWLSKTRFYSYDDDPESIKQWYEDNGTYLTSMPFGYTEGGGVYETANGVGYFASKSQEIHFWITSLTTAFSSDALPRCHSVQVYFGHKAFKYHYPEPYEIPEIERILVIRTCWANAY